MTNILYVVAGLSGLAYVLCRLGESDTFVSIADRWRGLSIWQRLTVVALLVSITMYGGAKGPIAVSDRVLSFMFFDPALEEIFPAGVVGEARDAADVMLDIVNDNAVVDATEINGSNAVATAAEAIAGTNGFAVLSLTADWPHSTREEPANIVISQIWVEPTNIVGELYEMRYLEFSAVPSESPSGVVKFSDQRGNSVMVEPVTNSYPDLIDIRTQSGIHSCYSFLVKVPEMFCDNLRTWEDDVKFGGPVGSGYGFEISGLIVVDLDGVYWRGLDADLTIGGELCEFDNGVLMPVMSTMSMTAETNSVDDVVEPLLSRSRGEVKFNVISNKLIITDGWHEDVINLAFPLN